MNFEPKQLPRLYYQVTYNLDRMGDLVERYTRDQESMGYKFHVNPEFQRGHVWTEEQQVKYLEWILSGGYAGIIVLNHPRWNSDYRADMYLVDGLQRLTAMIAFLDGEIKPFGYLVDDYNPRLLRGIAITVGVGTVSYKEMLEWYVNINSGGTPHTEAEINKVRDMITELNDE